MTGFLESKLILVVVLVLSASASASTSETNSKTSRNQTEFFTKLLGLLSCAERTGIPAAGGWESIDPVRLSYRNSFNLFDQHSDDQLAIRLSGSLSGLSDYVVGNVQVTGEEVASITFNATSGPVEMAANFVLTGFMNGSYIPYYTGNLNVTADAISRSQSVAFRILRDESTYLQDSAPKWRFYDATNLSFDISELPDNITKIINEFHPLGIFDLLSMQYFDVQEDFMNDFANNPPSSL